MIDSDLRNKLVDSSAGFLFKNAGKVVGGQVQLPGQLRNAQFLITVIF